MKVHAFAAHKPGAELELFEFEMDSTKDNEVLIKVKFCGICHSDIHLLDNDWDMTDYPFVPGHEIIGEVEEIGKDVSDFKKGDIVGLGWQCANCGVCSACERGLENCCLRMEEVGGTCVHRHGGFAEYVKVTHDFLFKIPEGLNLEETAPLLCGGITSFNPMVLYGVKPGQKVGVVGIGGLGHMAIKFAKAMGCEVYAFSRSENKKDEVLEMGAGHFVTDINDDSITGTLDFILTTVPGGIDWQRYVDILAPHGTLAIVGAGGDVKVDAFSLLATEKKIGGGSIGPKKTIKQMLDFCAEHKIGSQVEVFDLKDVNKAIEKVRNNDIRYRAVLKIN